MHTWLSYWANLEMSRLLVTQSVSICCPVWEPLQFEWEKIVRILTLFYSLPSSVSISLSLSLTAENCVFYFVGGNWKETCSLENLNSYLWLWHILIVWSWTNYLLWVFFFFFHLHTGNILLQEALSIRWILILWLRYKIQSINWF